MARVEPASNKLLKAFVQS